jgi:hypothetical protein
MTLIDAALSTIKFLFGNDSGCVDSISPDIILIIDNPLIPQLLQKLADVSPDFPRIGHAELSLQFGDDLREGALPVAALKHLASGTLQFDRSFGKEDYANLI